MNPIVLLPVAVFFCWGWWSERQQRIKLEKRIMAFYGNKVKNDDPMVASLKLSQIMRVMKGQTE